MSSLVAATVVPVGLIEPGRVVLTGRDIVALSVAATLEVVAVAVATMGVVVYGRAVIDGVLVVDRVGRHVRIDFLHGISGDVSRSPHLNVSSARQGETHLNADLGLGGAGESYEE